MSWLFKIEDRKVFPNEETLLIPPFSQIWERDESPDKWLAIREFAYIEFMTSQLKSNPYKGYSEKVREEKLREDIIKEDTWIPDELVMEAMKKIEEFQTNGSGAYTLLIDTLKAKETLQEFLRSVNLKERTDKGAMVLKPKDVTAAMLDLDKLVTSLDVLKKKVEEDTFETVKTRANKVISPFANPDSLNE